MSHFAQIDENNKVIQVLVIDQDTIDTGAFGDPLSWIKTSYNTRGNVHIQGGTPLRKNYAGIGYTYDPLSDAFIPPKPFNGWILNQNTCLWEAPLPYPNDGKDYVWNNNQCIWEEVVLW